MTDFDPTSTHPEERGHCKGCRWWQAEHDGPAAEDTAVGLWRRVRALPWPAQ